MMYQYSITDASSIGIVSPGFTRLVLKSSEQIDRSTAVAQIGAIQAVGAQPIKPFNLPLDLAYSSSIIICLLAAGWLVDKLTRLVEAVKK